jgi:ribonuclease P protein subunit RPR2
MKKRPSKKRMNLHKKNKSNMKTIAQSRINTLLNEAEKAYAEHPERSHRYSELAYKIKLKYKIKLTPEIKRRLCKKCRKFMVPGKTCRIRIHNSRLIYTCLECGSVRRFPLK